MLNYRHKLQIKSSLQEVYTEKEIINISRIIFLRLSEILIEEETKYSELQKDRLHDNFYYLYITDLENIIEDFEKIINGYMMYDLFDKKIKFLFDIGNKIVMDQNKNEQKFILIE